MNRIGRLILIVLFLSAALLSPAHAQRLVGVTTATQTTTTTSVSRAQDVGVNADIGVQVSGTWTGTLTFQATIDKTTWTQVGARAANGMIVNTTTANGQWVIAASGYQQVRVFSTSFYSGTATINWYGSPVSGSAYLTGLTVAVGTLSTTDSALTATVGSAGTVGITLSAATWSATVQFEGTGDGSTWTALPLAGLTGSVASTLTTTGTAGIETYSGSVAGLQQRFRAAQHRAAAQAGAD